jgi:hypothetical protein
MRDRSYGGSFAWGAKESGSGVLHLDRGRRASEGEWAGMRVGVAGW